MTLRDGRLWMESLGLAALGLAAMAAVLLAAAWSVAKFWQHFLQIRYTCPVCHRTCEPIVRCPGCNQRIEGLHPSLASGIWHRKCPSCPEQVATLDILGRADYDKICGNCKHDLANPGIGQKPTYHFGFWGDTHSGKSTLMVAALWMLEETLRARGGRLAFESDTAEGEYRHLVEELRLGRPVPKTATAKRPRAFTVDVIPPDGEAGCVLYLYDTAGDHLLDLDHVREHHAQQIMRGLIFVVDPFAEPNAAAEFGTLSSDLRQRISPARHSAETMGSTLLEHLQRVIRATGTNDKLPIHVAIVATKVGEVPAAKQPATSPDLDLGDRWSLARLEGTFPVVRAWLGRLGTGPFLRSVEATFEGVGYFAAESLPSPARERPQPLGSQAPLAWLADRTGALGRSRVGQPLHNVRRSLSGCEGRASQLAGVLSLGSAVAVVATAVLLAILLTNRALPYDSWAAVAQRPVQAVLVLLVLGFCSFSACMVLIMIYYHWHIRQGPLRGRFLLLGFFLALTTWNVALGRVYAHVPALVFLNFLGSIVLIGGLLAIWLVADE